MHSLRTTRPVLSARIIGNLCRTGLQPARAGKSSVLHNSAGPLQAAHLVIVLPRTSSVLSSCTRPCITDGCAEPCPAAPEGERSTSGSCMPGLLSLHSSTTTAASMQLIVCRTCCSYRLAGKVVMAINALEHLQRRRLLLQPHGKRLAPGHHCRL
jgi:hypothetical protein